MKVFCKLQGNAATNEQKTDVAASVPRQAAAQGPTQQHKELHVQMQLHSDAKNKNLAILEVSKKPDVCEQPQKRTG